MERADEAYWAALANDAAANQGVTEATQRVQSLHYEAAKTKALTFGFIYKTAQEIYDDRNIDDAKGRVMALAGQFDIPKEKPPTLETKALLGGIQKPKREDLTGKFKTRLRRLFRQSCWRPRNDRDYSRSCYQV